MLVRISSVCSIRFASVLSVLVSSHIFPFVLISSHSSSSLPIRPHLFSSLTDCRIAYERLRREKIRATQDEKALVVKEKATLREARLRERALAQAEERKVSAEAKSDHAQRQIEKQERLAREHADRVEELRRQLEQRMAKSREQLQQEQASPKVRLGWLGFPALFSPMIFCLPVCASYSLLIRWFIVCSFAHVRFANSLVFCLLIR